jgi:ATP-dependent RNA helicase DDX56/DBP9
VTLECNVSILMCFKVMAADREEDQSNDEGVEEVESSERSKKRKRAQSPPAPTEKQGKRNRSKKPRKGKDREYGVTRGVDFLDVSCVLNFDLPTSSRGYTHRVGRTARAGRTGMALSFVLPKAEYGKNKVVGNIASTKEDEEVWERIQQDQAALGCNIVDYNFDQSKIEAFRYRMEDGLRSVTRSAIKEGRIKDLKSEVLKSDKLKVRAQLLLIDRARTDAVSRRISRTIHSTWIT